MMLTTSFFKSFFSHDPEAYYNINAVPLSFPVERKEFINTMHYDNDDLDGFGVSAGFCVKSYDDDKNPIFLIKKGLPW